MGGIEAAGQDLLEYLAEEKRRYGDKSADREHSRGVVLGREAEQSECCGSWRLLRESGYGQGDRERWNRCHSCRQAVSS